VNHLAHLTRDGFRRLLGFTDVARILVDPRIDLDLIRSVARDQGMEVPILLTLRTVVEELRLGVDTPVPDPSWRTRAWYRLWAADRMLTGDSPAFSRHRQFWVAYLAPGTGLPSVAAWLRRWFPPPELLAFYYPHVPGPYLRRLVRGRWTRHMPAESPGTAPGAEGRHR
jgi:hypothetical protein